MRKQHDANLLLRLVALRWFEVACQILVIWGGNHWLALSEHQFQSLCTIVACFSVFNACTWLRLQRPWLVTELEIFGQICVDVLTLSGLLYFAGGAANPFVSLFLLPLTISAAILSPVYAWFTASLTVGGYSALLFFNTPLPPLELDLPWLDAIPGMPAAAHEHGGHVTQDNEFAVHQIGMWFNFLVSAVIIAFFLARLAAALRERERELAAAREDALRHEQILAIGTLAAGAAHQLGTPLATMAVVLRDLELDHGEAPGLREDLALMRHQVNHCKQLLGQLLNAAGRPRGEDAVPRPIHDYLGEVLDKWRLLRPDVTLRIDNHEPMPAPVIVPDPTLEQALLNLFDNAADVSPEGIVVKARWDAQACIIDILDRGPGISVTTAQNLGRPFFTTKREEGGLGLGLFLSNVTLERLGGQVELFNRPSGGACTHITLPFEKMR